MHADFWLQRWRDGQIGFHHAAPMPQLVRHWPTLSLPAGSRVLVPLAGKSLDMLWLADQGHRVLGVELSPLAVHQFLYEHQLQAETHVSSQGTHHVTDNIEIIQGDVFALADATLASCDAVYDRAAVIALPADMRERYAGEIFGRLPPTCRGLMITLEYPQAEMNGPPFSVDEPMLNTLFDGAWTPELLERQDILSEQPHFQAAGLTELHAAVYRLRRTTDAAIPTPQDAAAKNT